MRVLPIILAVITVVAAVVNVLADPDLTTKSLPTDHIFIPEGKTKGVIVLLSDSQGWTDKEEAMADALTERGALVIGVDLPDYYNALARETGECLYLVADIENLSRQLHRSVGIAEYHPPVVIGIGDGATLALAIAAQTPDSTIDETLAIDPKTTIPVSTVLCTPALKTPVSGGTIYGLTEGDLPNPIRVVFTPAADASGREHVDDIKADHPDIEVRETADAADIALVGNASGIIERISRTISPLNLPLVPIETPAKHNTMAIIYSGDGGWRDIDQQLGAFMKQAGIPVVGVDALRYFWSEKTPDQTAADLSRIISSYRARWKVDHVILVGYSFGANILPSTYRKLPEADQQAVSLVSLLGPEKQADYVIAVSGWLGFSGAGKYGNPVDDVREIKPSTKIQCIYGVLDTETACQDMRDIPGTQVLQRDGGHHFDGDYKALNALIVDRAMAAMATN